MRVVDRSLAVLPAASNGEFNLPSEFATVLEKGHGYRLWDVEGREYLDFSLGWGSVLVGHANERVVKAVQRRAELGANFSYVNDDMLALAERLVDLSPACDSVRFCASGTEANMYCQRLARAFTGKPKILKFEGAYHGANEIGVTSLFPHQPPCFPLPDPSSDGIDPVVRDNVLVAPFNDLEMTRRIVSDHRDQIAAITVEPLQRCTPPLPGFLEGLRDLTKELGIILIFDEVVTGFRLAYGGAQEYYGVVPDLVAYGKALGGGYPIGVFGGCRELMDLVCEDRYGKSTYVWMASTLGGNAVSCAAARATLDVFSEPGTYEYLHSIGRYLRSGMRDVLQLQGETAQVIGDGPLAQVIFTDQPINTYRDAQQADKQRARKLMLELFKSGVFLNPMGTKLYLSIVHDEGVCDEFLERFAQALKVTR